jgi:uncharacterized protein with GYD domain
MSCLPTLPIRESATPRTHRNGPKERAKDFGVTVKELVWTQGRYDIVAIVEAADEVSAMALNVSVGAMGNIRTETLRAFSMDDVTKIVGKMR